MSILARCCLLPPLLAMSPSAEARPHKPAPLAAPALPLLVVAADTGFEIRRHSAAAPTDRPMLAIGNSVRLDPRLFTPRLTPQKGSFDARNR
jgi:hypothetical protein